MKLAEVKEIIECLPKGKTRFYYFKDRYALLLLSLAMGSETSKQEIRQSGFSRLLDKEIVKQALSNCGGRRIPVDAFDALWPDTYECYFLSLGLWGSRFSVWNQTSRKGYNLVLQLNFSSKHDAPYSKLIDPNAERPFEYFGHPVAESSHTLAWARMDIDLGAGEALIEEIQTDWIRYALSARRRAAQAAGTIDFFGTTMQKDRVIRYVDSILRYHEQTWDEAMLSATLWFLRRELGVRTVYYHTHRSGSALKRISYRLPPRSIYTRLPRRFCFAQTDQRPGFLPASARPSRANPRLDNARFQVLKI